ncbi:zinc ribbon domain-containing protein [Haloarchaeobius salinus]|uniref:zinc ribbon domain-containing protein n=1 Tax=Haloarchaeobius salinus TaxID=1198298 RepID=UPI00210AA6A3|nr:zinc ribbon domain-containing protein [Haloarchaeobius salinus]
MGRIRRLVAVILSFLFPGLGHVYVRRFQRGLGFAAMAVGVVLLLGPPLPTSGPVVESALEAWEASSFEANVALSAVEFAAMLDVYLLERSTADPETAASCPNCGRELDESLSFCPWCAHELRAE